MCMVVYAWGRLSVMRGVTIKVVSARGLPREVVLHTPPPQEDESLFPMKNIGRFLSEGIISILKLKNEIVED